MKKNIVTLMLSVFVAICANAQKPIVGQFIGEKIPLYCGSTGSSSADSTRLPILFQAKLDGLIPGAKYKYYVRFIRLADTANSSATGAGTSLFIRKKGTWTSSSSPNLSNSGAHDTLGLSIGEAEYLGWFGAIYDNDGRFTPGEFVYPMIVIEEIGSGLSPQKFYLTDSIQVLAFSNSQSSGNGTAIHGASFLGGKNIVLLYDDDKGLTRRPVSITYSENESLSFSNMQNWYTNKVNAKSGAWGTIIPNDLSNGIRRIESRDVGFDTIIFANIELDATWGNDSTVNRSGGATNPVSIKSDYAPLLMPEFQFVNVQTNVVEANSTVNILVRRRYGNGDSSKISAFRNAGTATDSVDFKITSTFPKVFKPYGEAIDTIKVDIIDDFSSEATENIAIRLNKPVNARVGFQTTHSINITDNDIPVVSFDKNTITTKEGVGTIKVKLRINLGSTSATDVKVVVKQKSDSTFIPAEFKMGSSNTDTTVQFAGGKIVDSLEFDLAIVDDIFSEDRSDTVILALRSPTAPAIVGTDSLLMLVIEDNDAPSLYWLSQSKMTVKEDVGSVKIRINKQNGNINQSDIIVSYDSDAKFAQPGSDFTFNTQLLSFFTTDPDSFIITVPIINDNFSEPTKDAVIFIRNSFNSRIGKPDTIRITILDDDLPEYKIATATNSKSPNFIPDSLNIKCAIRGVVYGVNMGPVGATQGLSFTVRDNTGGIQVYKPSGGTKGYTVTEGDSVLVYGTISQLNGMSQMSQIDTIYKLGSGRALKSPTVINVLSEATESDLVKFDLVKLADPSAWPTSLC
ncbi:MAG: Calx-beta domain-containing protein [Bacteroidia bacterium]